MGKAASARFYSISIIPKPVPSSSGGHIIGTVGTTMAQKIATQTPNKKTGIHGIIFEPLKSPLVYTYIIKA